MFLHSVFHSDCMPLNDISDLFPFMLTTEKWNMIQNSFPENQEEIGRIDSFDENMNEEHIHEDHTNEFVSNNSPEKIYVIESENQIEMNSKNFEKRTIFASNVQDHLFWSMYLAKYGYSEYHRNNYNYLMF